MKRILSIVVFFFIGVSIYAQTIKGVILDKESRKPIPYVSIGIINTPQGTYAYSDGQFEMKIAEYDDRADKNEESDHGGIKMYQSLEIEVLYEK